jgi:hypothetical protein
METIKKEKEEMLEQKHIEKLQIETKHKEEIEKQKAKLIN